MVIRPLNFMAQNVKHLRHVQKNECSGNENFHMDEWQYENIKK